MKQALLFMSLFFFVSANAKQDEIVSKVVDTKSTTSRVRHAPARPSLLLIIEETGITIRFTGDFGPGYYQLSDTESGYMVSGLVVAEAGGTEFVSFPVSLTTSFDFYIEFEDGSWSHLVWGE